jgi:hypothetical protein
MSTAWAMFCSQVPVAETKLPVKKSPNRRFRNTLQVGDPAPNRSDASVIVE